MLEHTPLTLSYEQSAKIFLGNNALDLIRDDRMVLDHYNTPFGSLSIGTPYIGECREMLRRKIIGWPSVDEPQDGRNFPVTYYSLMVTAERALSLIPTDGVERYGHDHLYLIYPSLMRLLLPLPQVIVGISTESRTDKPRLTLIIDPLDAGGITYTTTNPDELDASDSFGNKYQMQKTLREPLKEHTCENIKHGQSVYIFDIDEPPRPIMTIFYGEAKWSGSVLLPLVTEGNPKENPLIWGSRNGYFQAQKRVPPFPELDVLVAQVWPPRKITQ